MADKIVASGEQLRKVTKQNAVMANDPDASLVTTGRHMLSVPDSTQPSNRYLTDPISVPWSKQHTDIEHSDPEHLIAALPSSVKSMRAELEQLREEKNTHNATAVQLEQLRKDHARVQIASRTMGEDLNQLRGEKENHAHLTAELQ